MPGRGRRPGTAALLIALVAAAAVASTAAGASTRIVLGRAIGPIAIGDERATIELRHGPGVVVSSRPNPGLPANPNFVIQAVRFPSVAVTARFPTAEASITAERLVTLASRYRTARGIGVGSSRATLVLKHPAAVCSGTICRIGVRAPGTTITRFHLRANRVWKVEIVIV